MKLNEILEFKKDLYFEGAVQADWFYLAEKSKKVSENFVFHGSKYYGVEGLIGNRRIDTVSFVKTIGEKLKDENTNPLTLAIADYGTGKSHLAVTLGQLLSGQEYMPETFSKIIDNISKIDKQDAKEIKELYNRRNLVLIINGMKDFNLHSEILKAAQKTLKLHGISDNNLKKINKSIEIAEGFFERNNQIFISQFETAAKNFGWYETGQQLIDKIRDSLLNDDHSFEIINEVYENTTGHKIRWDEGLSATNILEELINDYCGSDGDFDSVVILFDEFGRYLEYASGIDSGKSGDSALQQIFECTQNFEGKLQVINFIQSDIKTYLQRVDNTKNISRYIGRYDVSDKYYISSNLETVFANLIHRKNEIAFKNIVVENQMMKEHYWKNVFNDLNRWCVINGLWNDYSLFRNVIVEGIYPMHPISTFMLSQLSDYLQNRSSLTLISQYISNYSEFDISNEYFTILPEKLMTGDLFTEMLSAEQEGKQSSQHCIRFYNVLRKYEDKLNDNHLKVLRSNLVLRVLKCRTSSLEDILNGLSYCSGLTIEQVKQALDYLENEYGILGYDDRAFCFDFMEESNGAHDYKIVKKRLLASATFNPYLLRNNFEILEFTGNNENIVTSFGVTNRINTNEWMFKQSLYPAEDINIKVINRFIDEWKSAVKPDEPKGHVIWIYINKDTSYETIEELKKISIILEDMPIVLMVLNDSENRLCNDLIEYSVIHSMDDNIKSKYERHYLDDVQQNKDRIKSEFNNLKKERLYITNSGITQFENRITKELSNIFSKLYPKVASFHFDGLLSKAGNLATKQSNNFLTIVKLLMGNGIDSNIIHNYSIEIRNRIEALLFYKSATSWKCLNDQYHVVPPTEPKARYIYDQIANKLDEEEQINCKELYETLVSPPYGLNNFSCLLMISVVLANLDYCTRVVYDETVYSTKAWRDLLFVKEGKVDFDLLKESKLIKVDAGVTEEKFLKLFKEIGDNKDVDRVDILTNELNKLMKENDLPERLEDSMKLAKKTLDDGKNAKKEWNQVISKIKKYNSDMAPKNLYPGFQAMEFAKETDFASIFTKYKYEYVSYYRSQLSDLLDDINDYISENFNEYVYGMRCNEVERLIQFRNHGFKTVNFLQELGYIEYANIMQKHVESEIANIEAIRDKQNLKADCDKFFKTCKINKYTSFVQIKEYMTESHRLIGLFNQFSKSLGNDSTRIKEGLIKTRDLLKQEYEAICNEIGDIYDNFYEIDNVDSIYNLLNRIEFSLKRGLPDKDKNSLIDLENDLKEFKSDIEEVSQYLDNRYEFKIKSDNLVLKYEDTESEISLEMVNKIIDELLTQIDKKEESWKVRYLKYPNDNPKSIYVWKENTKNLPLYLSEETIKQYEQNCIYAEEIISKDKINTAIHYYNLLSDEEKKKFIENIK